jgi:hypothetical protein
VAWGNADKVSMRVGLIPVKIDLPSGFAFQCLSQWLDIVDEADQETNVA